MHTLNPHTVSGPTAMLALPQGNGMTFHNYNQVDLELGNNLCSFTLESITKKQLSPAPGL